MNKDVFDGFTVNLFLDEDGDYLAHFVEMPNVSAFSNAPSGALENADTLAWKGVKESGSSELSVEKELAIRMLQ